MRWILILLGIAAGAGWTWSEGLFSSRPGEPHTVASTGGRVMFQYVDEHGGVRFVETLEQVPPAQRESAGRIEIDPPRPDAPRTPDAAPAGFPRDVVVVTIPGCGYCRMTMAWLDERGVPYTEVDMHSGRPEVDRIGRRFGRVAAPTVHTGDDVVFGWNEQALERLFGS